MTTLSPPPIRENILQFGEPEPDPPARWRTFLPRSRRGQAAVAGALTVVLIAGVLGATYETSPGGTLWGVEKTIFPNHSQDVALSAVVSDLKQAQDILGNGQQPTPDQLTDVRNSLNQAKQDLDYLPQSPQRTNLQNLYLQLTQQLLQYTPDSAQQLPPLPVPAAAPVAPASGDPSQPPDVALTSATAPSWGYPVTDESGTFPPPPGVPDAPLADWPQPYAPPLTPNLGNLGYYDPSWGQLYGYDAGDWYNYDLSGYNRYGYDFLGFDRWGYDRWGYDRWGYDHWGYNWAGYNWAGYDRDGWDRDGRNDWGQRRDHPGDPRDRDWYDGHHAYEQYYQWKFRDNDPVFRRTQWDRDHGFNRDLYRDWNMARDWHDPRNRDWAPPATPRAVTEVDLHVSAPVVNLNASLTQFISADKVTDSRPLMKDLANKSARDFARELNPRITLPFGPQPVSTLDELHRSSAAAHQTPATPPALTVPPPALAPSKVSPGFAAPKLSPVPAYAPPKAAHSQDKPEPTQVTREPQPTPATRPGPVMAPAPEGSRPVPAPEPPSPERTAPPTQHVPAPAAQAPAPEAEAPEPRQAPVHQAPAPRARQAAPEAPFRQAPPAQETPPAASRPAPQQRSAPAPERHPAPTCALPSMC